MASVKVGRPKKYLTEDERKSSINRKKATRYRIDIGSASEEWHARKEQFGFKTHSAFAAFLLKGFPWKHNLAKEGSYNDNLAILEKNKNSYTDTKDDQNEICDVETTPGRRVPVGLFPTTSTPLLGNGTKSLELDCLSNVESEGESDISDLEPTEVKEKEKDETFRLTSEETESEDELDITNSNFEQEMRQLGIDPMAVTFGTDGFINIPDPTEMADNIRGFVDFERLTDSKEATNAACGLAYMSSLKSLAQLQVPELCPRCDSRIKLQEKKRGTAVALSWVCEERHPVVEWWSQPRLNQMNLGDISQSMAIVLSGNNYQKIALLNRFMKCGYISKSTHCLIQTNYTIPCVEDYWKKVQGEALADLNPNGVVVMGDGRNDSPGHCAQYATYSIMSYNSSKILSMNTIDKRQARGISNNMEKLGFEKCFKELQEKKIKISEVITDEHPQITALMKKKMDIKHSFDIWHVGKNLCKRINESAKKKDCEELRKWTGDIKNHLWYTASSCEEDGARFLSTWRSLLHHVCDQHTWDFGRQSCAHESIEEREKNWMNPSSEAFKTLTKLVLDERLLKKIPYLVNFRHTGHIETYHELVLMYAAKRYSFTPPAYKARCQLAAIDWNKHVNLPQAVTKTGEERYRKVWSKNGNRWQVIPEKVAKPYAYIDDLRNAIFIHRFKEQMNRNSMLHEEDPRNISSSIAPQPAPSIEELLQSQKHRF